MRLGGVPGYLFWTENGIVCSLKEKTKQRAFQEALVTKGISIRKTALAPGQTSCHARASFRNIEKLIYAFSFYARNTTGCVYITAIRR